MVSSHPPTTPENAVISYQLSVINSFFLVKKKGDYLPIIDRPTVRVVDIP